MNRKASNAVFLILAGVLSAFLLTCKIDSPYLEIIEDRIIEIEELMEGEIQRPEVSITTSENPAGSVPIAVTITFSRAVTGFDRTDISVENAELGSVSTSDNTIFNIILNNPADDPTTITVNIPENVAEDSGGSGNIRATALVLAYDTSILTASMESSIGAITNINPIPLSVIFSDTVEGFGTDDLNCTNCIVSGLTTSDNKLFEMNVVPTAQGTIQILIPEGSAQSETTGRGNIETVFETVYDSLPPAAPLLSGETPTPDLTPEWNWTSGGGGNGTFRYRLNNPDLSFGATGTTLLLFSPDSDLTEEIHTLYVQERDEVGNWSVSGSLAININTAIPGAPGVSGSDYTRDRTPEWSWSPAGGVHGSGFYRYSLDDGSGSPEWSVETASTSYTGPETADNATLALVFSVQERSGAGLWSAAGTCTTVVDNQAPERPLIGGVSDDGIYGSDQSFTLSGIEDGAAAEYFLNGGPWTSYSSAVALTADTGTTMEHTITARQTDRAGNISPSADLITVTIDKEGPPAPGISISGGTYGSNQTFTLTGVEIDASSVEYSLDGGTVWIDYSEEVSLTAGSGLSVEYGITARQTDAGGGDSAEAAVVTVIIDKEPPSAPSTNGLAPGSYDSSRSFTLSDIESGASAEFSTDNGSTWNDYSGSVNLSANSGQSISYSIKTRQTDSAGNLSDESSSVEVTIDRQFPAAPGISGVTDGSLHNSDQSFTLTGLESGAAVHYSINGGSSWSSYSSSVSLNVSGGIETVFNVQARQTDPAGNTTTSGTVTVTIDKAAPAVPGIGGISDNAVYGSNQSFSLSGIESEATGSYSINNGTWTNYSSPVSLSASTGNEEEYDIRVRQTDQAGNTSSISSEVTIIIDKEAPVGTFRAGSSGNTTVDPVVTLYSTGISGAEQMCFRNDSGSYTGWETFSTSESGWSLEDGVGLRTVYAKYRDEVGNEYETSDSITSNPSWQNLDGDGLDEWPMSGSAYSGALLDTGDGFVVTTSSGRFTKVLLTSRGSFPTFDITAKFITYDSTSSHDVYKNLADQNWTWPTNTIYIDLDSGTTDTSTFGDADISIFTNTSGTTDTVSCLNGAVMDMWSP